MLTPPVVLLLTRSCHHAGQGRRSHRRPGALGVGACAQGCRRLHPPLARRYSPGPGPGCGAEAGDGVDAAGEGPGGRLGGGAGARWGLRAGRVGRKGDGSGGSRKKGGGGRRGFRERWRGGVEVGRRGGGGREREGRGGREGGCFARIRMRAMMASGERSRTGAARRGPDGHDAQRPVSPRPERDPRPWESRPGT